MQEDKTDVKPEFNVKKEVSEMLYVECLVIWMWSMDLRKEGERPSWGFRNVNVEKDGKRKVDG